MATSNPWRQTQDKRSGRTYYYNVNTRATQWHKPKELATPAELVEMNAKEAAQKEFFSEMEGNIRRRLQALQEVSALPAIEISDPVNEEKEQEEERQRLDAELEKFRKQTYSNRHARMSSSIRLVRTISTIDDSVLEELKRQSIGDAAGNSGRTKSKSRISTKIQSKVLHEVEDEENDDAHPHPDFAHTHIHTPAHSRTHAPGIERPPLARRNSTGTIYLDSVMSHPDNEATIKCVCAVIRAHMMESIKDPAYDRVYDELDAFRDNDISFEEEQLLENLPRIRQIPSLGKIKAFFKDIFEKSSMESECVIISLVYIEKLIKATRGKLKLKWDNWRPVVFICMIMASKVWDDLSMWNSDFSQVCPAFTLGRINELELAVLDILTFSIKVSASEYAKYYFHLRSLMARLTTNVPFVPLDIAGAKRLELATEEYHAEKESAGLFRRRSLTVHEGDDRDTLEQMHTGGNNWDHHYPLVSLEQMIHAAHSDGDGAPHRAKSPHHRLERVQRK